MSRSAYVWTLVVLLAIANIIAYVDRTNLSVAIAAAEFKAHFSLTNEDRGYLNAAFFWSYALLQIPAGAVADRFGVKYPFAGGLFLWSIVSAVSGFANTFVQLFIFRLFLGLGEAILTPGALRWIRFNVDERQRGSAVGIFFAGAKIGPALGAVLSVWLMGVYGWRVMFIVLGLGSLLWLIPWLSLAESDRHATPAHAGGPKVPFAAIFRSPVIYGIVIATFSYNYFNYFCMTWLPSYFVEHLNLSLERSGAFTAFSFGGFAVVAILAGVAADRLIAAGGDAVRIRRRFAISGLILASVAVLGAMTSSHTIAIASAIVSLTALGLTTANYWALTQTLMPAEAIGRATGVQNFASNTSGIVASILTGKLVQWTGSYQAPVIACSAILIVGAVAYAALVRKKYAPQEVSREEDHDRDRPAVVGRDIRTNESAH